MSTSSSPVRVDEWATPGTRVVAVTQDSLRGFTRVSGTTVDRVLTRDLVCADGTRWNRKRTYVPSGGTHELLEAPKDTWHTVTTYLYPADHFTVAAARAHIAKTNRAAKAESLTTQHHRTDHAHYTGTDPVVTARQVADAWAAVAADRDGLPANQTAIGHLTDLLDTLPADHPDRRGVTRAIEALRTIG